MTRVVAIPALVIDEEHLPDQGRLRPRRELRQLRVEHQRLQLPVLLAGVDPGSREVPQLREVSHGRRAPFGEAEKDPKGRPGPEVLDVP